jgi:glycosyltransferase XagB
MTSASARVSRHGWVRVKKTQDPSSFDVARAANLARSHLADTHPVASMRHPAGRALVVLLLLAALLIGFDMFWGNNASAIVTLGSCIFAGFGGVRVLACFFTHKASPKIETSQHFDIAPDWSVLIALYNEADSVAGLVQAISQLEWDPKKLDVIFVCERDDRPTLEALTRLRRYHRFRIVRVPSGGPRTKPNALQTALPFARGRYLSVYDAEDRPDPLQLRAAFQAFIDGTPQLAVVQAPLVSWNDQESWIARQFTLDYAIWFRIMLPFLSRLSGVLPLGGTSNHFRTDILRQVGGWDPYNVTEDADLGIRLGRQGYQAALIDTPTFEEAPPRIGAWIKQRGRWIQGHIQTVSLHLRQPIKLVSQLGFAGLASFVLGLGMGPLAALYTLPSLIGAGFVLCDTHATTVDLVVLGGLSSHWLVAVIATRRDGRKKLWRACFTQPLYFGLQSVAACRAVWRVVFTPSFWDKTDHGCAARAKTARRQ